MLDTAVVADVSTLSANATHSIFQVNRTMFHTQTRAQIYHFVSSIWYLVANHRQNPVAQVLTLAGQKLTARVLYDLFQK